MKTSHVKLVWVSMHPLFLYKQYNIHCCNEATTNRKNNNLPRSTFKALKIYLKKKKTTSKRVCTN